MFHTGGVVVGSVRQRRIFILAKIHTNNRASELVAGTQLAQALRHRHDPLIIETHSINQSSMLGQTKQARLRIAGLRTRRHGTHFDKAKTQARQPRNSFGILIQTRCKPNRVGELTAKQCFFARGIRTHTPRQVTEEAQT